MIKHGQIVNSGLPQREKHSRITKLYALSREEKLEQALKDFADGSDLTIPAPPEPAKDAVFNPVQ